MLLSEQSCVIRNYFENAGYERFLRIYQSHCLSRFQRYVRDGHRETIDTVMAWLGTANGLEQVTVCDAGCGVGTLSLSLARAGASVHGVDFSTQMIGKAKENAHLACSATQAPRFEVEDMMNLRGNYHTLTCIDVLPRYSDSQAIELLGHLNELATHRLVVSFTPKTWLDPALLMLGNSVAKRNKAPFLYTHASKSILNTLAGLGWQIVRQKAISARYKVYYSHLVEFRKAPGSFQVTV